MSESIYSGDTNHHAYETAQHIMLSLAQYQARSIAPVQQAVASLAGDQQAARLESVAFHHALIALAVKCATIDGVTNKAEYAVVQSLFMAGSVIDAAQSRSWFVARANDDSSALQYARQVLAMTRDQDRLHAELLGRLLSVATADGPLNAAELELLRAISQIFGFTKEAFRQLIAGAATALAHASPYAVLGITPRTSDKELREHYMARVQALHPDRYQAVGASEQTIAILSDQLAHINAAYQQITRERAKKTPKARGMNGWFGTKYSKGASTSSV